MKGKIMINVNEAMNNIKNGLVDISTIKYDSIRYIYMTLFEKDKNIIIKYLLNRLDKTTIEKLKKDEEIFIQAL